MTPFKMPPFYLPWPARLNPAVEEARVHSKEWALSVGILESPTTNPAPVIWTETNFDSMDLALLCAFAHPDSNPVTLNLLSDWYVWLFYLDDHFVEMYKRTRDQGGAADYLGRLSAFMPLDLAGPTLEPENPSERALVDLWLRTAPEHSRSWRERFRISTLNVADAFRWELANLSIDRVPNPIEYIEMRRMTGGAPWSADLVEHAVGIEIPSVIAATRPMLVVKDTFSDVSHLRNDLFSYQREIEIEGENSNCVLVFERFLGCDTQEAADRVNHLATSRMHQFENSAMFEVPLLFDEYRLSLRERVNVFAYIKGLEDWQAGAHEWHLRSSRYMNESGGEDGEIDDDESLVAQAAVRQFGDPAALYLSAARIAATVNTVDPDRADRVARSADGSDRTPGYPFLLPDFYMPWPWRCHAGVDELDEATRAWACQMGLVGDVPGVSVWDEATYDTFDFAPVVALCHPDASDPMLELVAQWYIWGFAYDDYMLNFKARWDLLGARVFIERQAAFMSDGPHAAIIPMVPIERALVDLWARTAAKLPPGPRRHMAAKVFDWMAVVLWEIMNLQRDRIPDPVDFVEMRRKTAYLIAEFVRLRTERDLPHDIENSKPLQALREIYADNIGLRNDIYSYQKEMDEERDVHNGVLVFRRFLGCDVQQSVDIANDLMTARLKEFERIEALDVPAMLDEFAADETTRQGVEAYLNSLKDVMAGENRWYELTRHYIRLPAAASSAAPTWAGPTGFGTAASRIASLIGPV